MTLPADLMVWLEMISKGSRKQARQGAQPCLFLAGFPTTVRGGNARRTQGDSENMLNIDTDCSINEHMIGRGTMHVVGECRGTGF